MVGVVGESGGDEGAGVAEDHERPKPSARSLSAFRATPGVREFPAPKNAGGHGRSATERRCRRTSASATGTSSSGSSSTRRRSSSRSVLMRISLEPTFAGRPVQRRQAKRPDDPHDGAAGSRAKVGGSEAAAAKAAGGVFGTCRDGEVGTPTATHARILAPGGWAGGDPRGRAPGSARCRELTSTRRVDVVARRSY